MTLEIITATASHPLRHGFFTRRGGASSGIFAGLNCGTGSTDQTEMVRSTAPAWPRRWSVAPDHLVGVNQVHSAEVVHISTPPNGSRPRADAHGHGDARHRARVLTADCQPVLFADPEAGVIGAAHAGWRGALDGVLEQTVEAMERLGARREAIAAVIGPTISQRAYEVGPEFLEDFLAEDPDYARFFAGGARDRLHFDLPAFGLDRLRRGGVEAEWTRHCTYSRSRTVLLLPPQRPMRRKPITAA